MPTPHSDLPTIRRARADDVPAIVRLLADDPLGRTREDSTEHSTHVYAAAFLEIDQDPHQLLAVLELAAEVAGTLQLTFIPGLSHRGGRRAQIEAVRIATAHRGRGLGEMLLRWAIDRARERGCHLAQLATDKSRTDARRFYERLGFKASHEGMKLAL